MGPDNEEEMRVGQTQRDFFHQRISTTTLLNILFLSLPLSPSLPSSARDLFGLRERYGAWSQRRGPCTLTQFGKARSPARS